MFGRSIDRLCAWCAGRGVLWTIQMLSIDWDVRPHRRLFQRRLSPAVAALGTHLGFDAKRAMNVSNRSPR
jgi:hypothetical protein